MKRIILEKSDRGSIKIKNRNYKVISEYTPITELPREIKRIRNALVDLKNKGMSYEMVRIYVCAKSGASRIAFDIVVKGLIDIVQQSEKEHKIKKLKE